MKREKILLGYEVGSGAEVHVPLHHMVVTGLTQLSGKTTTLEALIARSGRRALAFRTKRGEIGFDTASRIRPFYQEKHDWQYVQALLEATMKERMKFERSWIIKACHGATSLRDVYDAVVEKLEGGKLRGIDESIYTNLRAYFDIVLPEIERYQWATSLDLRPGANVMDLTGMREEVQALVIRAVLERVYEHEKDVVLVIPEAWKFLPERRGNPVKSAAEHVIREGAVLGIFLWIDSQDIANVAKAPLKSVDVWLLGRQREINEVEHVLKQLPAGVHKPKPEAIMKLRVGHFWVAAADFCKLVYVLPAWLDPKFARRVALGEIPVEDVAAPIPEEDDDMVYKEKWEAAQVEVERMEEEVRNLKVEKGRLEQDANPKRVEELESTVADLTARLDSMREEVARTAQAREALKLIQQGYEQLELADLFNRQTGDAKQAPSLQLQTWIGKLGPTSPPGKILEFLAEKHPMRFTVSQLAVALGYSAKGGAFQRALGVLTKNNLVVREKGDVSLSTEFAGGT